MADTLADTLRERAAMLAADGYTVLAAHLRDHAAALAGSEDGQ